MATSSDEVEHLTLDSWTTVESMLRQVSSTGADASEPRTLTPLCTRTSPLPTTESVDTL